MKRPGGFTLIELAVVVAVVAILASLAVPLGEISSKRAKEQDLRRALREIRVGIDAYKKAVDDGRIMKHVGVSGYPPRLEDLVRGVVDAKDANGAKIYFMRRLPRDPMQPDPALAPADTWGKRCYASPPDAPAEGDDVFDIFSRSDAIGLNGVPYHEW